MNIIAHRGYWQSKKEQNTKVAFERAVKFGFGIEADFRDANRKLVIAHDMPIGKGFLAKDAFRIFKKMSPTQILAINIKSDGLQDLIFEQLKSSPHLEYFIFDAAISDLVGYRYREIKFFTRQSEFEEAPVLLTQAAGIWLDAFKSDWFTVDLIERHLISGKDVCVVSPELHGRAHMDVWKMLKGSRFDQYQSHLSICTDLPVEAKEFFS